MTEDQDFIDAIELSTSSVKMVNVRFDKWLTTLKLIVGTPNKEPRCFSRTLKQELFAKNGVCTICGNAIADIDDAHVDHVEQYWLGGKTIPENARLTHRFCNMSRSRKKAGAVDSLAVAAASVGQVGHQ
jgi:5-methylcytosine-specific restriction endonuclease McrA